jgi:hypothetical protein
MWFALSIWRLVRLRRGQRQLLCRDGSGRGLTWGAALAGQSRAWGGTRAAAALRSPARPHQVSAPAGATCRPSQQLGCALRACVVVRAPEASLLPYLEADGQKPLLHLRVSDRPVRGLAWVTPHTHARTTHQLHPSDPVGVWVWVHRAGRTGYGMGGRGGTRSRTRTRPFQLLLASSAPSNATRRAGGRCWRPSCWLAPGAYAKCAP